MTFKIINQKIMINYANVPKTIMTDMKCGTMLFLVVTYS